MTYPEGLLSFSLVVGFIVLVIYLLHLWQKEKERMAVWKILAQSLGYTYSKTGAWGQVLII